MVDPRRLYGNLAAATILVTCLAACEAGLAATSRWWPDWLKNDWAATEYGAYFDAGSQITGVLKQGTRPEEPIGLLLGASHLVFAIDLPTLESEVRPRRKWLRLTVYGGSTCEFEQMTRLLVVEGRIEPATVVINLALTMLARPETHRRGDLSDIVGFDPSIMASHLGAMRLVDLEDDVETLAGNALNTLFPDRNRINRRLNSRVFRGRIGQLERMGQGIMAMFKPDPAPWGLRMPSLKRRVVGPGELSVARQARWFEADLYSPTGEARRSLIDLIRLVRSVGSEVIIVLMPAPSIFRAAMPDEARQTLSAALTDAFGAEAPRIVNLKSFARDEFFDLYHLDEPGKARVTKRLIEVLDEDPSSRRSMMSRGT